MDKKIILHNLLNALQRVRSTAELLEEHVTEEAKKHLECIEKDVQYIAHELRD